jgi:hypothetical protein
MKQVREPVLVCVAMMTAAPAGFLLGMLLAP